MPKGKQGMKRHFTVGLVTAVLVALPVATLAGAKFKISDDSELELGLLVQTLTRYTDFRNPDSDEANGGQDFILRRGRIRLNGNITDYVNFYLQTDAFASTDHDADFRMIDAAVDLHYENLAHLIMGLQKAPSSREILTDSGTLLTMDRPGITNYNLTWGLTARVEFNTEDLGNTDSGLSGPVDDRDIGATLFGALSFTDWLHFKYYAGIYNGIHENTDNEDSPRLTFRGQLNLLDPEPDYNNHGTYLGQKKTVAIGYTYDVQNDVTTEVGGTGNAGFFWNEVDLFVEYPVGPGSATFEWGYNHM
jgi:hypothetical protein